MTCSRPARAESAVAREMNHSRGVMSYELRHCAYFVVISLLAVIDTLRLGAFAQQSDSLGALSRDYFLEEEGDLGKANQPSALAMHQIRLRQVSSDTWRIYLPRCVPCF